MPPHDPPLCSITPKTDGPLVVKDLVGLNNKDGAVEIKPVFALCRCGQSNNKPFCDGTHSTVGFSSKKEDERLADRRESYRGSKITIHDNRGICAHAGLCTDRLSTVFRMKQKPWIDPDGASAEDIIAAVNACPSGALSYSIDDVERTENENPATISVSPNGPYIVTGVVDLVDTPRGDGAARSVCALCRCGGSKNKPFCDGSHWHNGFTDDKN